MQDNQVDKVNMPAQYQEIDGYVHTPMLLQKIWWLVLNVISFCTATYLILYMISGWVHDNFNIDKDDDRYCKISMPISMLYLFIPGIIHMRYRGMPYRLIGRQGKTAVDCIILVVAIMLRLFFPYDGTDFRTAAIFVLISVTLNLHGWGQSLHRTWDICMYDVLLHALMELGTYIAGDTTCNFLIFFFSCVICYRYFYYSAPSTPEVIKKDLEALPC